MRYNIVSVSLYDSLRVGYGTITSGITFSIFSPDSMAHLTFSYSRLYEYPTHAVLQSSGLSRNVGTLENGLFRLPSSSDFLSLGSFRLDLRIYRTSALLFYSFRIKHFRIRYIWYINFFGRIG